MSLNIGDFLCLPKTNNNKINNKIKKNNKDLATLLGYWISEGSIIYSHKPKICGLRFTLNIKEDHIFNEIKEAIKSLTYTSISQRKMVKNNKMEVYLYGKELAELIIKLGGSGCSTKKIDRSVFQ